MVHTQHLLISGRVQGVSYRFFVENRAQKLGLTGWVRNLTDGRVEALVQGLPANLEELLMALERGPIRAQVEHIRIELVANHESMKEFKIRDNGSSPWQKDL